MKKPWILGRMKNSIGGIKCIDIHPHVAQNQLPGGNGIYVIICLATGEYLVGEGKIGYQKGNRILSHFGPISFIQNKSYKYAREKYPIDSFRLVYYYYENNVSKRKDYERDLQEYFINLGLCFNTIQLRNCGKNTIRGESQYRGVYFDKRKQMWGTCVCDPNKFIGYYNTEIEAAMAFDWFIVNNGIGKPINFIDTDYTKILPPPPLSGSYGKYIKETLEKINTNELCTN